MEPKFRRFPPTDGGRDGRSANCSMRPKFAKSFIMMEPPFGDIEYGCRLQNCVGTSTGLNNFIACLFTLTHNSNEACGNVDKFNLFLLWDPPTFLPSFLPSHFISRDMFSSRQRQWRPFSMGSPLRPRSEGGGEERGKGQKMTNF